MEIPPRHAAARSNRDAKAGEYLHHSTPTAVIHSAAGQLRGIRGPIRRKIRGRQRSHAEEHELRNYACCPFSQPRYPSLGTRELSYARQHVSANLFSNKLADASVASRDATDCSHTFSRSPRECVSRVHVAVEPKPAPLWCSPGRKVAAPCTGEGGASMPAYAVLTRTLMQLASRGTVSTLTLPATPTEEFIARLED